MNGRETGTASRRCMYFWCAARAVFVCAGTSGAISECLPALPKFISARFSCRADAKTFRISIAVAANGSRRYRPPSRPRRSVSRGHARHVVANWFTLLGSFKIETSEAVAEPPTRNFYAGKNVIRMADIRNAPGGGFEKTSPSPL